MPPTVQKVVFARINRRLADGEETIEARSFLDDMITLAESRQTTFTEVDTASIRTWFAADMFLIPGQSYMTGTLGYETPQQSFDAEIWSWIVGRTKETGAEAGDPVVPKAERVGTIVPFAIDLANQGRWVSFAPTVSVQAGTFVRGFESVLNSAAVAVDIPAEWEVDLVVSRTRVDMWIRSHPLVYRLQRTIKFTNPGRNLDDDRREMRALAARRKTEEFVASSYQALNIFSQEFGDKLDGIETGDIDLILHARGGPDDAVFNSSDSPDTVNIDDFAGDLVRGTELVLTALRQYVGNKLMRKG